MSEQTANLCTTDACESLRARLAKYDDAEGRPVVVGDDRAAFEAAYAKSQGLAEKSYSLWFERYGDTYTSSAVASAWWGWQQTRLNSSPVSSAPSDQYRDLIWMAHQLADMVLKGDAPHTAVRVAKSLMRECEGKASAPSHGEQVGEIARLRELLTAWRRMFDGGIASGELGVLRGQTDALLAKP